ncbi:unnamed protein product, partial [marine sediment metagenome]
MAISGVVSGVMSGGGLANLLLGIYPPLSTQYSKWAFSKWPNMIPGVGDLVELAYRGLIDHGTFLAIAAQNGFSKEWAENLYIGGTTFLPPGDYLKLWRRGELSEKDLEAFLLKQRFSLPAIEHIKKATEFFPSPQDLISFAVREVYSPEIVA